MKQLAIVLRAAQLFAHNAHNIITGPTFFEDHEFLGELYPKYEEDYDSIIERMIGLDMEVNLTEIQMASVEMLQKLALSSNPTESLKSVLVLEQLFCEAAEEELKSEEHSEGTRQLIGGLCDSSESRQYKIKQRTKSA